MPSHSAKYEHYRQQIMQFWPQGKYEQALAAFEELLLLAPTEAALYYNHARLLKEMKRYQQAVASLEKAIGLQPDIADLYFLKGGLLEEINDPQAAEQAFLQYLTLAPRDFECVLSMGLHLFTLGRLTEAFEMLETGFRHWYPPRRDDPFYEKRHLLCYGYSSLKARLLHEQGQYEAALTAIDEALQYEHEIAAGHQIRGVILHDLGNLDESLAALDQALALEPELADAHRERGRTLVERKHYEQALLALEKALHLQPDDERTQIAQRQALMAIADEGHFERALHFCDRLIAHTPKNVQAWDVKADLFARNGQFEEANHVYDQILTIDPLATGIHTLKGYVLTFMRRYQEALEEINKDLQVWEHAENRSLLQRMKQMVYGLHFANRGHILLLLERQEEALQAFDHAIRWLPEEAGGYEGKSAILIARKRYEEALDVLDEGAFQAHETGGIAYYQNKALYELGRFREAQAALIHAARKGYYQPQFSLSICRNFTIRSYTVTRIQ